MPLFIKLMDKIIKCQAPTEEIMELAKKMWEMKLNDEIKMPGGVWIVTRVPGGWIYQHNAGEMAVFVPLDNEFTRC